ncbi:helix-turn-helix domain-containing protein [Clostridium sp.]|uniref:helix-turn-helix domain-containing protein n=1 Tax=Clostridium sp. TaxID=1506 RepID=UPI0035A0594C
MIIEIKKYREYRNLSLKALADIANCSKSYLGEIERKEKLSPGMDILYRVGHALHICPKKLIMGCNKHYCSPSCYYYESNYNEFPKTAQKEIFEFVEKVKRRYGIA